MATKHPLLDHVLDPERVVIEAKKLLVSRMSGLKWTCRMGEQYIASCTCTALIITSDAEEVTQFEDRHRRCDAEPPTAEQQAEALI